MPSFRGNTHVFVIRAWLEPREIPGPLPEWRYSVEHVGSGGRRYTRELSEVAEFMRGYLPGPPRTGWRRQLLRLFERAGAVRADR